MMLQIMNLTGYRLFLITWLMLFSCFTSAADRQLPKMEGGVTDTVGLLSTGDKSVIDSQIMRLEKEKGAQIAVLIVSSTDSESIESYAERTFNTWRLGRLNVDDGLLLVVALDDRTVRIEVGYGLEGAITDAFAAQIINKYIIPHFKQNDYAGGIKLAVDVLYAKIMEEPLLVAPITKSIIPQGTNSFGWIDILSGILIGCSFLMWFSILFRSIKHHPLKAGLPIAAIFFATWLFNGFDFTVGNGLTFGEDFLYTELPQWVQLLLLQYLPAWMTIVMFFSIFIVVVFLFLLITAALIYPFVLLYKKTKSAKVKKALISFFGAFPFALFAFLFTYIPIGRFFVSAGIALAVMIFISAGIYTGKIKRASGSGSSRDWRESSGSRSSSSGSSSRSGGGGASGRW